MMNRYSIICFALLVCACSSDQATKSSEPIHYAVQSPGELLIVEIGMQPGTARPTYAVSWQGSPVISTSRLGYELSTVQIEMPKLQLVDSGTSDTQWTPVWGQSSLVRDHFNYIKFNVVDGAENEVTLEVEVRAYDDGVAFRYRHVGTQDQSDGELREVTEFSFVGDQSLQSYGGESTPKLAASLAKMPQTRLSPPVALTSSALEPVVVLQEAALMHGAPMSLVNRGDRPVLEFQTEPLKPGIEWSAWRVIQVAEKIDALLLSDLLTNLSPENKIPDSSWIRPGKALWDWRVRGAEYGDFNYQLDNASLRRFIDFAADNGMQYVMIDANWYGPEHEESSDPFTSIEDLDIPGLIAEGNEKGVGFILYLNDKADARHDLDELFQAYSAWGAAGVKYGFLKGSPTERVAKTMKIVETAARHRLLVNFHDGPIPPSGLRRTWPNWVTREYVHAQTDSGRSFTPTTFLRQVNLNMLAGPLDMSNGFYQLDGLVEARNYVRQEVYSTVAGETARALIVFSGLIILPDAPEEYERKSDLFEFLQRMPASWDETRIISNVSDRHIIMARREGESWFLGAAANEDGGTVPIVLNFLEQDRLYDMTVYSDTEATHFEDNREVYEIINRQVRYGDDVDVFMAPGGGQAIWLRPYSGGNDE